LLPGGATAQENSKALKRDFFFSLKSPHSQRQRMFSLTSFPFFSPSLFPYRASIKTEWIYSPPVFLLPLSAPPVDYTIHRRSFPFLFFSRHFGGLRDSTTALLVTIVGASVFPVPFLFLLFPGWDIAGPGRIRIRRNKISFFLSSFFFIFFFFFPPYVVRRY